MTFILLVLKEWKVSLIVLLSTLLLTSIICISQLQNAEDKVKNEFDNYIDTVEKQNLINQNKQKQKELEILEKQKQIEVQHNEQIKNLSNDVANARDSTYSLQQKLNTNSSKFNTLTKEQANTYNNTISNILSNSLTEYQGMAKIADEHRLAEQRCIGLYNALIDDKDNKKGLSTESP
jgi:predicted nuclease with TOPRIM domain